MRGTEVLKRAILIALAGALLVSCGREKSDLVRQSSPEKTDPQLASAAFHAFVDDYFNQLFAFRPVNGTSSGFHQYDPELGEYSAAAFRNRVQALKSLQARLDALRRTKLSGDEVIDAMVLDGQIKSELLDTDELQLWRKNPMAYVSAPGEGVDSLMKRDFAPANERLRSLVRRLRQVPAILTALRENVVDPPPEFTDLSIRMAAGSVGFFRGSVAQWAKQAAGNDRALIDTFDKANQSAIASLESTVSYLQKDLRPRSKGEYAIGARAFSRKLEYEEMVDLPLDQLLAIGETNLEKDRRDFIATAKLINPNLPPAEVMKSITRNHPTAGTLLPTARELLTSLRDFLGRKSIIKLPSEALPIVAETPPYARSGSFASMDTPGAYERAAKEAFYYITPPESDWTPQHVEEHLREFSHPVIDIISVHEVYPGHYTQFLFVRQFPTKTRKLIACGTNVEGWAHYTEQMMIEEGLGSGDPRYRLAQLAEALVRDARFVTGIKLHTQGWTVQNGAKLFVEKAFQEPANGFEEARRGAYNPTYLYYTLGKLEIYKLREDYKKAKGSAYSLDQFHTDFVRQGGLPIKLMRQILLPDKGSGS
jgi:uncharacterized protein (DUF885 family)